MKGFSAEARCQSRAVRVQKVKKKAFFEPFKLSVSDFPFHSLIYSFIPSRAATDPNGNFKILSCEMKIFPIPKTRNEGRNLQEQDQLAKFQVQPGVSTFSIAGVLEMRPGFRTRFMSCVF